MLEAKARRVGCALLISLAPLAAAGDAPPAKPGIVHKVKFARAGDAKLHCACVTTRSGCDTKLSQPLAAESVHQWWQTLQVEAGESIDVAAACWRKRDVPGHGDALCCSPVLNQNGDPMPAELRKLYGASTTEEPVEGKAGR
jgi:hypothetical protein